MKFRIYSPAKVILFGEHFVVYNYPAIAAAIKPYNEIEVEFLKSKSYELEYYSNLKEHCFKINKKNKHAKHFLAFLYNYFLNKYPKLKEYKIIVKIKKIWPLKGVGNSSSIAAAFSYAIEKFLKNKITSRKLYEYIQESDKIAHGKPSGIDAATISYGGMIRFQKQKKPKQIYFKKIKGWKFILIDTKNLDKKSANTKKQIQKFAKNKGYEMGKEYKKIFLKAKKALEKGDGTVLSSLIEENHKLLEKGGVSSKTTQKIVKLLKENNVAAKITGAGGVGGSLIALVKEINYKNVKKILKKNNINFYEFEISKKSVFG